MSGSVGLRRVRVRGFRSARDLELRPGPVCALVGEVGAGKSNVLAALRALLDAHAAPPGRADLTRGGEPSVRLEGELLDGTRLSLHAEPPAGARAERTGAPPVLFLPADLRAGPLVDAASRAAGAAAGAAARIRRPRRAAEDAPSAAGPALALVRGLEACLSEGADGVVLLVEEPELYLRPQAQRYLYRLLRAFARAGNQVVYSTHAPAFLNVARLEELALLEHDARTGTRAFQPEPLPPDEAFRAFCEFDAERGELFLARSAILVEGRTEKLALPFVFRALGHDADAEAISIVDCGGKSNLVLFARVCQAASVPFLVVHDRDAPPGRPEPHDAEVLNELIRAEAGPERTIVLAPDFEGVAGLRSHAHKPEHAWRRFGELAERDVPPPLARAVELAVSLARG